MRRLTEHMAEHARDERGVTAIVVAVVLTVLLGMGAIVVDVGAIYQERRELQNGADAGALAVAEDCSMGDCGSPSATADPLADANAGDDLSTLDGVSVDMAAQTAKVDTSTSDADGGTQMLHWFAPVLGIDGTTVRASATAVWGAVESAPAVPLAVSSCEFDRAVPDPDDLPSGPVVLTFHDGDNAEPCNGPAGQDIPGGFGWLDESDCTAEVSVEDGGAWVDSETGVSIPKGCSPTDFPLGEPIMFPVFDDATDTGNNGTFHLVGYAAMELTAYSLHPGIAAWTTGLTSCPAAAPVAPDGGKDRGGADPGKDAVCIAGRFVHFFEADASTGGPSIYDFGVRTVELIA